MTARSIFHTVICSILIISPFCVSAEVKWHTDYDKALQEAQNTGKIVLANFTGSDWCTYCIKADTEIFSKAEFAKFAEEKLVLLKIDFPRKTKLPADQAVKNNTLADKYKIEGFPTLLLLDSNGEILGKTGYVRGGAENWVMVCDSIMKKIPKPKKVIFKRDYAKALTEAKTKKLPLLMLVFNDEKKADLAAVDKLSTDKNFAVLNDWKFASLALDDEAVAKHDVESIKEIDSSTGPCCVLIDPHTGQVRYKKTLTMQNKESIVKDLQNALELDTEGGWLNDFDKAKLIAQAKGKHILVKFTGSDWCSWCKKMDESIFKEKIFEDFADDNLVLVELDFPRATKLPENIARQNDWLMDIYGVQGFPTVIMLDPKGNELARGSYYSGKPEEFIRDIKSCM